MSDSLNQPQENTNLDAEDPLGDSQQSSVPDITAAREKPAAPLAMVETAFLASTASLIWFINFYFPLGPLLRIFFPIPIALVYLRWGNRAAWMAAGVSGLLLSVLMGPIPSLLFVFPYGVMGVVLGVVWYRRSPWIFSIVLGTLTGTLGFFFRFWLMSIWLSRDLWMYMLVEVTEFAEWIFDRCCSRQERLARTARGRDQQGTSRTVIQRQRRRRSKGARTEQNGSRRVTSKLVLQTS